MKKTIAIVLAITAVLLSCKEPDPDDSHSDKITAFGKTATVFADASVSAGDFTTAVGNLRSALTTLDADTNLPTNSRSGLTNMMKYTITIVADSTVPANVSGALRVGAGYLKSNNGQTIETAFLALGITGGFTMAAPAQGKVQLEERTVPVTQIV
jgi:hypothetical protein